MLAEEPMTGPAADATAPGILAQEDLAAASNLEILPAGPAQVEAALMQMEFVGQGTEADPGSPAEVTADLPAPLPAPVTAPHTPEPAPLLSAELFALQIVDSQVEPAPIAVESSRQGRSPLPFGLRHQAPVDPSTGGRYPRTPSLEAQIWHALPTAGAAPGMAPKPSSALRIDLLPFAAGEAPQLLAGPLPQEIALLQRPSEDQTAAPRPTSVPAASSDGQAVGGLTRAAMPYAAPPLAHDLPAAAGRATVHVTEIERVRLIQRVSRALHAAADQGGVLRLRLSPPELGSVQLEVSLREGTMHAHLSTETTAARTLLLDHLPELRERLADLGVRLERFDVTYLNTGTGGQSPSPQDHRGGAVPPYRQRINQAAGEPAPAAAARRRGQHGLDVLI
jgi:hypothetical protein